NPLLLINPAPDLGDIRLPGLASLELPRNESMRLTIERHEHQTGCILVQPVNDQRPRKFLMHARQKTVSKSGMATRHRKQAARLVKHKKIVVPVKKRQIGIDGRMVDRWVVGRKCHNRGLSYP